MATGIVNPHSVAAAGFNPETDINWHTLFWAEGTKYKATNTVNGAQITTLPDEYGAVADDATMSTGSSHFLHGTGTAGVLNGQPYWNTTANPHGTMSTGPWVKAPPYVGTQSGSTVIIIFEPNNPTTTHSMLMSGPNQAMGYLYMASGNTLAVYGNSGGTAGAWGSSLAPTKGAVNALRWYRTALQWSYMYLNGLTGQQVGYATPGGYARYGVTGNEGVQLGSYATGGYPFQGAMAFMGIYSDNNGYITSDPKWNDLKAWALSHYGATLT